MNQPAVQNDERWVIIFLIYADFVNEKTKESKSVINIELLETLDSLCEDLIKCKIIKEKFSIYAIFSTLNYELHNYNTSIAKSETLVFKMEAVPNRAQKNEVVLIANDALRAKDFSKRKRNKSDLDTVQKVEDVAAAFKIVESQEKEEYPNCVSKIMLNTWGHGSAFGIFKINDSQIEVMVDWKTVIKNSCNFYLNEFAKVASLRLDTTCSNLVEESKTDTYYGQQNSALFEFSQSSSEQLSGKIVDIESMTGTGENKVTKKEFSLEILSNRELAEAIKEGFRNQKVDVLIMMNCWMMNIDTMYWLKNSVNILIAPQTGIEYPAYNYKAILEFIYKELNVGKKVSSHELSAIVINSLKEVSGKRASLKENIEKWAVFSIDLNFCDEKKIAIDNLVFEISNFSNYYLKQINQNDTSETDKSQLRNLFKFCTGLSYNFDQANDYFQFDLSLIIFNLIRMNGNLLNKIELMEYNDTLNSIMNSMYSCPPHIGRNWNGSFTYKTYQKPIGLSIFTPNKEYKQLLKFKEIIAPEIKMDIYKKSFFNSCTDWLKFIDVILS